MDDRLRLIRHLYDEDDAPAVLERRLAEDEALRREYRELRATKAILDRRPARSPHPDVVDRVVERAGAAARQGDEQESPDAEAPSRAADRSPQPPAREDRTRWVRRTSAALATLLLVTIGWWAVPTATETATTADGASTPSTAAVQSADAAQSPGAPQDAESMPAWDDRDDLVRLHRRIELLQTQDQGWNEGLQAAQARP